MRIAVLGPVDVVDVPAPAPSGEIARRVLAVLAAEANRAVHPDRLADLVWPGRRPPGGNSLQAHISRWRKALGAHRITYSPAGYTLVVGPLELDALEFEEEARLATTARADGDLPAALAACDRAVELWRGAAFDGLSDDLGVHARKLELETARAAVRLARLELWCEVGAFDRVVGEAAGIAGGDGWNEPVHRVWARAHYGRGDQVAALQVLADLEARLRSDLGLDLSTASQLLREQMLRQEPALDLVTTTAAGGGAAAEQHPSVDAVPLARLAERLGDLPTVTQQILHAAALSGPALDTALLARVLALDGSAMADAVAPALAAGIVVRTDGGIRFAGGVCDAVVELVPAGAALDLHRRLGEALLATGASSEQARSAAAAHLADAAPVAIGAAQQAVALDHQLASEAMGRAQYAAAVHHAHRALASATHVGAEAATPVPRAALHFSLAEALHRAGDLNGAMAAYLAATQPPDVAADVLHHSALAYEECSLHARRHRTGARDRSIELLESALSTGDPAGPARVDLLAALAQALSFSGLGERASALADRAVAAAHEADDPERLARTLLRAVAVHDPVAGAARRAALAADAVAASQQAGADELELDALCAWVPELMRAGEFAEVERVVAQVEHLVDVHDNVLHRCKVPMWRAAIALYFGRFDEAEVLIDDFRHAGLRDGYDDTHRIHGFQSILLALGRGAPEDAGATLERFADDVAFEPWRATALLVAHARDDEALVRQVLVPWSARRFTLARPFAGVQVFCACLVAEAVAECGDATARERLADVVRPGVGLHQVLGAGAAILGDAAVSLGLLTKEAVHD